MSEFPGYDECVERMYAAFMRMTYDVWRAEGCDLIDQFCYAMDDGDEPWMRTWLAAAEKLVAA